MVFDLHIHTKYGSADSYIDHKELVPYARQAKLDGICITEHGFEKTRVAERLSQEYEFLILEGIEFSTDLGDMLVYGIDSIPRKFFLRADELSQFVIQEGGAMFAAHPFRSEVTRSIERGITPRVSLNDVLHRPLVGLVDGFEVANGSSVPEDVAFCQVVCEQAGLKSIGGSDAHQPNQIGSCVTIFENSIYCEADFVAALKGGGFYAEDRRQRVQKSPKWWVNNKKRS
jgi:predicted metal-dependent phosphoesterase TrpH